jgi:hypothetical protein
VNMVRFKFVWGGTGLLIVIGSSGGAKGTFFEVGGVVLPQDYGFLDKVFFVKLLEGLLPVQISIQERSVLPTAHRHTLQTLVSSDLTRTWKLYLGSRSADVRTT